jgi:hypothetical protein
VGNHHHVLVELERAESETRFCFCGEYMIPVADADGIWLQCRTVDQPNRSRIARFIDSIAPHDRRLIIDLETLAPQENRAPSFAATRLAAIDSTDNLRAA